MQKGAISVGRFITSMDGYFAHNDLVGAGQCLRYWMAEARTLGDERGLLSVLNEALGYYRRTEERERGLCAVEESLQLLERRKPWGTAEATILVNTATTLRSFGEAERGLVYYQQAEEIYQAQGWGERYEYAALLNNQAAAWHDLQCYDREQDCYLRAIAILQAEGRHDGEIAVTLCSLAQLSHAQGGTATVLADNALDVAWEYLHSPTQAWDGNYAFLLTKCAPAFRYFGRRAEAEELEQRAKEIYSER